MPTALTQPRQFGWQTTQLNFIGNLRSSRATPACAEPPSMATRPTKAILPVAAPSNFRARVVVHAWSVTSAGYRGFAALRRSTCIEPWRRLMLGAPFRAGPTHAVQPGPVAIAYVHNQVVSDAGEVGDCLGRLASET